MMLTRIPQTCSQGGRRMVQTSDGLLSVQQELGSNGRTWYEVRLDRARFKIEAAPGDCAQVVGNARIDAGFTKHVFGDTELGCWHIRVSNEAGDYLALFIPDEREFDAALETSRPEVLTARFLRRQMWTAPDAQAMMLQLMLILLTLLTLSSLVTIFFIL